LRAVITNSRSKTFKERRRAPKNHCSAAWLREAAVYTMDIVNKKINET
jgi:hypothetical protein